MRKLVSISLLLLSLLISTNTFAQEKKCKFPFKMNIGADLMSRYVWRGMDYGKSASIQPTLSFGLGNFEIGYWGAIALTSDYMESDLYLKYSLKGFSVMLTDYYIPNLATDFNDTRYSFCKSSNKIEMDTTSGLNLDRFTTHAVEATLQYKGPEKFPISVLVATYIHGNDKTPQDSVLTQTGKLSTINFKNRYSTYVELGYSFAVKEYNFDVFLGATPFSSVYSTPGYSGGFAVVNTGITGYRKIKISDKFELPVKASAIFNPQASAFHFVFGITL